MTAASCEVVISVGTKSLVKGSPERALWTLVRNALSSAATGLTKPSCRKEAFSNISANMLLTNRWISCE